MNEHGVPDLLGEAVRGMLEPLSLMEAVRDSDGKIVDLQWTFINSAGTEAILLPAEQLLGHRLLDVLPEHQNGLFDEYCRVIETGDPFVGSEIGYDDTWGTSELIPRVYNIRATKCGDGVAISWNDVTTHVSDRHDLRQANSRMQTYEQIVELAGIGIWVVDANERTTYANRAMCTMLARGPEEVIGRTRPTFMDANAQLEYNEILTGQGKSSSQRDVRFLTEEGENIWARLSMTRLYDGEKYLGNFAMVTDVSDEVRALNSREEAHLQFLETTANAPIGHALVELDGTFREVNTAFSEITGYGRSELVGMTFQQITFIEDLDLDVQQASDLASGLITSYSMDKRYRRKDDSLIWVKLFASVVRDSLGAPLHFVAQVIDIDRQKLAEDAAAAALDGLAYRSTHDALTELPNRDECVHALRAALADPANRNSTAVLFIDIDHFKEVNDGISHSAGDAVLTEIGKRIRGCVQHSDVVSRLGGDEFAVVTTTYESVAELIALAERIRARIADKGFEVVGARLHITVSIGIASAQDGSSPQSLLSEADLALYRAKELGRNCCEVADTEMLQNARARLSLLDRMHGGVERNEFHAWYQPVTDLATRKVVGFEALARWELDGGAMVASDFIQVAEDSGLIHDIGATVITESIGHLAAIAPEQILAVNASPHQLQAPNFALRVLTTLAAASARPDQLAIEITEQALLKAGTASDQNLSQLHKAGVKLYVDDFGVGFSSLAVLRDYPIDGIKLDRSFSVDFENQSNSRSRLVSGLSQLAEHLGLDRIAEGIETENQLDYLLETGWTRGQGYLFGRAVPPAENAGASRRVTPISDAPGHKIPRPATGSLEQEESAR